MHFFQCTLGGQAVPRTRPTIPPYRVHKASGQGYVVLDGRRQYLGRDSDPATHDRYVEAIVKRKANRDRPTVAQAELRVCELLDRFLPWAEDRYRKPDGSQTGTIDNYKSVMRVIREVCGSLRAADFGVEALELGQRRMKEIGWVRTNINRSINLGRRIFRWGAARKLVARNVFNELRALETVPPNTPGVPESTERLDVPLEHVEAVRPFVSKQVWSLIQLALSTGARAGEIVGLRPVDINTTTDPWTFSPVYHKTAYRRHKRVIRFGPKAQAVINEFLPGRAVNAPLFSAREAEKDRHAAAETHRRENQLPNPVKTERTVGVPGSASAP